MKQFYNKYVSTTEALLDSARSASIMAALFSFLASLNGIALWQDKGQFSFAAFLVAPFVMIHYTAIALAARRRRKLLQKDAKG